MAMLFIGLSFLSLLQFRIVFKKGTREMSYHGKLQTLKNGTADAEIQQWAFDNLAVADINFENAERIIEEQKAEILSLLKFIDDRGEYGQLIIWKASQK